MSFQKCPACNGTGVGDNNGQPWMATIPPACIVCNGGKIINEQTGLPVYKIITTNGTNLNID